MGAGTLRREIETTFSNETYDEILSILSDWGQGPAHARSCRDYMIMLNAACGDRELLRRIVDAVREHPDQLPLYQRWQEVEEEYRSGVEYLRFFASCVRAISVLLVPRMAECGTSHHSLTISRNLRERGPTISVIPLMDGSVFVSDDNECIMRGKTRESQSDLSGVFTTCADAPPVVLDWYTRAEAAGPVASEG
jgi:hypothetical protein